MNYADTLLKIDGERTIEIIKTYLNNLLKRYSARGFLMGLSGGIDSAVLATLAAGAPMPVESITLGHFSRRYLVLSYLGITQV